MLTIRSKVPILLACLIGLASGILLVDASRARSAQADDAMTAHGQPSVGVKAPIQEILHCPLAFAGVHLLKDLPEHAQVAYHYCKPVNDDVSQCVLYDGTGPDAKLIGIEYLVSDALYRKMPTEEKLYWHDHKYEVDSGLLKSMTQTGEDEKKPSLSSRHSGARSSTPGRPARPTRAARLGCSGPSPGLSRSSSRPMRSSRWNWKRGGRKRPASKTRRSSTRVMRRCSSVRSPPNRTRSCQHHEAQQV